MRAVLEDKLQEKLLDIAQLEPDEAADIAFKIVEELDDEGFFEVEDDE